MHRTPLVRRTLFCLALALPPLAPAAPLAPFVLTQPGLAEIKYTGYLARSADTGSAGTLKESTFAAGYMTSIGELGNASNVYWQQGQHNQSISFMMYGIGDAGTASGGGSFGNQVYSTGCTNAAYGCDGKIHLDFYLDKLAGGTNPGFGVGGLKASQRSGFDRMQGLTDGQLLMRWEFVPGLVTAPVPGLSNPSFHPGSTTLFQEVNTLAYRAAGIGTYLADCVAGPACSYFRSGSQAGGADFFGINTMTAMLASSVIRQNGWGSRLADPVIAQIALPEPGVPALLAAGLLAMARRRGGRWAR